MHSLLQEITLRYQHLRGCRLETLFIGGGTPTVLKYELIAKIVEHCRQIYGFAERAEISIEANPGTVNLKTLRVLKECGITRLSLGVQAFSEKELTTIGRVYAPADVYQAFEDARKAGFEDISLDLMYGLPVQTVEDWRTGLDEALSLGPEHLSLYQLSIEENTPFHLLFQRGALFVPEEDTILEMDRITAEKSASAGYGHYEISNYSKADHECRHNLIYWKNEEYMACGAGAVRFCDGVRAKNIEDPASYCSRVRKGLELTKESEKLGPDEAFRETVMLGLRLIKGVSRKRLYQRFGLDIEAEYAGVLDDLIDQGLLELKNDYLRLTTAGLRLANRVMAELI